MMGCTCCTASCQNQRNKSAKQRIRVVLGRQAQRISWAMVFCISPHSNVCLCVTTASLTPRCVGLVCSGAVQPWFTTTDKKPGCIGEDCAAIHHFLNFARLYIHIRGGSLRTLQCTVGVLAFNVLHVSSGRAQGSGAYFTSSFHSHSDEPLQLFDGPRIVPSSACGRPR